MHISFSLPDQTGTIHTDRDYLGRYLVMYFYPKDETPGCTKEACAYRDIMPQLKTLGATVVGVSADDAASHQKFVTNHSLTFPLLVDTDSVLAKQMGAYGEKSFMGKAYMGINRNTYIIGPDGSLLTTYEKVDPIHHIDDVVEYIRSHREAHPDPRS